MLLFVNGRPYKKKEAILVNCLLYNPKKPNENNLVFLDPTVDFDFSLLSGTKVITLNENNKSTVAHKYRISYAFKKCNQPPITEQYLMYLT